MSHIVCDDSAASSTLIRVKRFGVTGVVVVEESKIEAMIASWNCNSCAYSASDMSESTELSSCCCCCSVVRRRERYESSQERGMNCSSAILV